MSQELIEQTFTVTGPARLVISNVRGSVVVRPGEAGVISIQAARRSDTGSHTDVRLSQDADGTVRAEARHNEGTLGFMNFSKPCKVDFTASVPAEVDLTVSVVNSSLDVAGLSGNFDLNGVSGDIKLSELSGPLKINTVSGDVTAAQLSGALNLESVSGDVRLDESGLSSAKVRTVSGDVLLQTPLGEGPYHFNSVSGDVRLVTLPDTHCTAELSTISGKIVTSLAQTTNQQRNRSQTLEIQGGGVHVYLNSVSGDLIIGSLADMEKREAQQPPVPPVPPVAPVPPVPAEPPAARLSTAEILEKIERGEMSVEEGLQLIQGG